MTLNAIISQVKETPRVNKLGQQVVYRDVFLADTNTDFQTRYPGEVVIRPEEKEFQDLKMAEGVKLIVHIKQVLEVRNGLPVVRAVCKSPASSKAA